MQLDFHFRVLFDVVGTLVTEEMCSKPELLDSNEDNKKASVYWLSFTDHRGALKESDKKLWLQDF